MSKKRNVPEESWDAWVIEPVDPDDVREQIGLLPRAYARWQRFRSEPPPPLVDPTATEPTPARARR